jgi:hypothetical protein
LVQTPDLSLERKRETQRPVEKRSLSIATTRAPTKKQAACYFLPACSKEFQRSLSKSIGSILLMSINNYGGHMR